MSLTLPRLTWPYLTWSHLTWPYQQLHMPSPLIGALTDFCIYIYNVHLCKVCCYSCAYLLVIIICTFKIIINGSVQLIEKEKRLNNVKRLNILRQLIWNWNHKLPHWKRGHQTLPLDVHLDVSAASVTTFSIEYWLIYIWNAQDRFNCRLTFSGYDHHIFAYWVNNGQNVVP